MSYIAHVCFIPLIILLFFFPFLFLPTSSFCLSLSLSLAFSSLFQLFSHEARTRAKCYSTTHYSFSSEEDILCMWRIESTGKAPSLSTHTHTRSSELYCMSMKAKQPLQLGIPTRGLLNSEGMLQSKRLLQSPTVRFSLWRVAPLSFFHSFFSLF